jgi:hypothetical protein
MTDTEIERLTDPQVKELARKIGSLARAHVKLLLEVDGPLHDVEVYLGDDQKSAVIYAPDGRGHWATATFELFQFTSEDAFDCRALYRNSRSALTGEPQCV